jgi:hypothetical protein
LIWTVRVLTFARSSLVGAILATTLPALLLTVPIAASWARLIGTLLTGTARLLAGVMLFSLCHYGLLRGALRE